MNGTWPSVFKTYWGRVTHIWVRKLSIIDSDNGFSPGRRQAFIWTIAGIFLILNSKLRKKPQWNLKSNSYIFIQENAFDNVIYEMAALFFSALMCHGNALVPPNTWRRAYFNAMFWRSVVNIYVCDQDYFYDSVRSQENVVKFSHSLTLFLRFTTTDINHRFALNNQFINSCMKSCFRDVKHNQ